MFNLHFIGLGAEKAGTTQVAEMLAIHPEICMSEPKEVNFFNEAKPYIKGGKNENYGKDMNWYIKHFGHHKEGQKRGEFTTFYLYDQAAPKNIFEAFPDVKLIVCMRHPIKRTFSQYIMYRFYFKQEKREFEEAMASEAEYVGKSKYFEQISKYLQYFDKEQMLFLTLDEIKTAPLETIQKVYGFLGIDNQFVPPNVNAKANAAKNIRFPAVVRLMRITSKALVALNLSKVVAYLKSKGLNNWMLKVNSQKIDYPEMKKETEEKLQKEFAPDIAQLEKLLKRDFPKWKK